MQNNIKTNEPVGLLRRFGAIFYDALLLIAVLFFASLPIAVPLNITIEHPWYSYFVAYIYLVSFLFFGWFWTHGGQTLGLKTWKSQLVSRLRHSSHMETSPDSLYSVVAMLVKSWRRFYLVLYQQQIVWLGTIFYPKLV